VDCQQRLYQRIADPSERGRLAVMNTAESGYFAADRAIREYAEDIWHIN
jgi:starch phosphorylase